MTDLAAFWDRAWDELAGGVADGAHPMRIVTLATLGPEGPQARSMGLRLADRQEAVVAVHTDRVTPKVSQIEADPRVALLAWNPESQVQVRLTGRATVRSGAEVEHLWQEIPPEGRINYGTAPDPGAPIPGPFAYEKPAVRDRFAVLSCRVETVDVVDLSRRHLRAIYVRGDGFAGTWVAP